MRAEKTKKTPPKSLIEAYRQAFDVAQQTSNPDDKIKAYVRVVDFCANTQSCRWSPNIKRNVLLYWAHNNIARSLLEKTQYMDALKYWQKAVHLAADNTQKTQIWEQMIDAWGKAPVSIQQRCEEIIKISKELAKTYAEQGLVLEVKRLAGLAQKLSDLLKKSAH